jgi:Flp pilus assembly protein TadD/mono/diheme cytochrome c family protein
MSLSQAARLLLAGLLAIVSAAAAEAGRAVTYYHDIAPILYKNCVPCHRPGESGPFSLLSLEDARRHAAQIAAVTKRRFMPPWLPEPGYGEFIEERRLSDAQIGEILEWVRQGAPAGNEAHAPAAPKPPPEWPLGKPDLVLHVQQPYQLPASGPEVFWNFVVPVPIKTAHLVRAVQIRPGTPRAIHHASIILDRARSARGRARGAGFAGMDLAIAETTFDPDGSFLAWKPGSIPMVEPEGMAWRADPGMDLIFNVHLRPTGKAETVDPEIGLYFTDQPRTRFPMLLELEHDGAIDIPAGTRDYVVSDDLNVPLDLHVLAVYPHAHYLATLVEGYATLPDGTRRWLIRIPAWDLSWQGVYHLRQPLFLPRGSVISMRFHYDNSAGNIRNPHQPPVRVRGGSQADDEMGNLWLQVLPDAPGDQRLILQEAVTRRLLEKYPGDFTANFNMGDLLLNRNDATGAVPYFEAACRAEPRSALAATELGTALASASRFPEAIEKFHRALELDAAFVDASYNLASAEAASGQMESAAADFKKVLAARPDDGKARDRLGEVLFAWGDQLADSQQFEDAAARYREALQFRPGDAALHTNLGMVLARVARYSEARAEFEAALKINPELQPARNALAHLTGH